MPGITRSAAEDFLYHEAALIDGWRLNEWLELFTDDGIYWLPIDPDTSPDDNTSIIYDIPIRRHERVFRLLETPFPSQSPRSRLVHAITNVRVDAELSDGLAVVRSNQMITELRAGDFRQTGLGEQRTFVGTCEHHLRLGADSPRIKLKKLVLLNRDISIRNLTFVA